jgi:hypothetical protein
VHFAHPAMPDLPHQSDRFQPAEAFFDPLPLLLAGWRSPSAAWCGHRSRYHRAVPGSAPRAAHPQMAALLHKPERVIAFVASHRQRLRAGKSFHHDQGCIAFCGPVRLENLRVYDQSVAVLHQQIAAVTQLRLFPATFARQQGVGIGLGLMRFVRALLSAEVHRGIARIIRRKRGLALFDLKSLPSRLGFQ